MRKCINIIILLTPLLMHNSILGQTTIDSIFEQFDEVVYTDIYHANDLIHQAKTLVLSNEQKAKLLKRQAIVARIKTQYTDALNYNLEALDLFQKVSNRIEIAEVYHNMGFLMRYIEDYDKALEYFTEAIKIRRTLDDKTKLGQSHRELGVIYRRLHNYDKALLHYDTAKSLFIPKEDQMDIITLQGNYASLFFLQKDYDSALKINIEALPAIKSAQDFKSLATRYGNIAIAYKQLERYDKAILYIDSALQVSKKANLLEPQVRYYFLKARTRSRQKNYRKAYRNMRKYKRLNDSLTEISKLGSVEDQLKAFKYEKRIFRDSIETTNALALLENKVKYEQLEKRNLLWVSILIGLVLMGILFWQRSRTKMAELVSDNEKLNATLLKEKLKSTEQENKRLVDESHLQYEFKKSILDKIDKINTDKDQSEITMRDLQRELINQLRIENQSNTINQTIENLPSAFEEFLRNKYPTLTKGERKMCFLVKNGMTIKEIANLNQTSSSAVQSMRYRIRKKLSLERGQELKTFLEEIF